MTEPTQTDPTMAALFAALNQTNALILQYNDRIRAFEQKHHAKCSPSPQMKRRSGSHSSRHADNRRHHWRSHNLSPSPIDYDEEQERRGPLSRAILDAHFPVGLEKLPPLGMYDGTTDTDKNIENINALLYYRGVPDAIKCRWFPTTLCKGAVTWYISTPNRYEHYLPIRLLYPRLG